MSAITGILTAAHLNIENMVNQSRGAFAYTVADVSVRPSDELIRRLRGLDAIYRVRLLTPQ